jgi:hypothetical protein
MKTSVWKSGAMAIVLVAVLGAPVAADEAAARAALEGSVAAQEQVLDVMAQIDGAEALDERAGELQAAMAAAERANAAMMPHVPEINTSATLEAEFAPQMTALYERRAEVQAGLRESLDEASMMRLLVLLQGE